MKKTVSLSLQIKKYLNFINNFFQKKLNQFMILSFEKSEYNGISRR